MEPNHFTHENISLEWIQYKEDPATSAGWQNTLNNTKDLLSTSLLHSNDPKKLKVCHPGFIPGSSLYVHSF